jgi:hypothetical protein
MSEPTGHRPNRDSCRDQSGRREVTEIMETHLFKAERVSELLKSFSDASRNPRSETVRLVREDER